MSKLAALPFPVQITRAKRKTAVIYARHGKADVRVPLKTSQSWVERFVTERSDWICKQLEAEQQRNAERFELRAGSHIEFLGARKTICWGSHSEPRVELIDDRLYLPEPDLLTDTHKLFHSWLKQQAEAWITPLARQLTERVGVAERLQTIRYRKNKSRWGYCTREGMLQFNWLIMLAPEEVVHYLVSHEVCHLRHMNHSRIYWQLVDSVCPDRKQAQKWLRHNEHRLLALY